MATPESIAAQGGAALADTGQSIGEPGRALRVLLLEPRARYRKALLNHWNAAVRTSHDDAPPDILLDASGSIKALQHHLEGHTFEACVFPLLDQHASIERMWQALEAAGFSIGYLFHVQRPGRKSGVPHERIPYVCKTRFGCHQHVLTLLGLIDMTVLEVRPPDDTPHERYRKILNRIAEGFWDVGPDMQLAYANTSFKNLVGDKATSGRNLLEYFEEGDRARITSILNEQQEGIIIPFTMRLRSKDGRGAVVQIDPTPRFGWGGKYLGASALVRDVSHLELASEESLRKEQELYTLYAVASTLTRSFGLHDLVTAATEKVREQLSVDATSLWLVQEDGALHAVEPRGVGNLPLDAHLLQMARRWCEDLPDSKPAVVVRDTGKSRQPLARSIADMGYRSMAGIALQTARRRIGYLWLACHDPSVMNRGWVSMLISIGHQVALAVDNSMHVESRLQEEARRKEFYREAVFAITSGKLSLLERPDMAGVTQGKTLGEIEIVGPETIRACRELADRLFGEQGFAAERCFDVAMCVSEAATNVLLHGNGGRMTIFAPAEDRVGIMLEDRGPGINFSELPRAVLKRGYSTAVSMGLGFTMILEMMDAVFMCTDDSGTTIVMEAHLNPVNAELEAWLTRVQD